MSVMTAGAEAPGRIQDGDDYKQAIAAFSEVAAALSGGMELDALLHVVCDNLCRLIGIARASIFLKEDESSLFRGRVARNHVDIDEYMKRYVAGTPADRLTLEILKRKEPVLVTNAQADPRPVRAQMRRWDIRTIFGVPMIQNDEVIGLVFLDNGDEPYPYTTAQQELAQVFSNLAAMAVNQAAGANRVTASLDALSRQNELLKQLTVINDRLAAQVLEGASIGEMAEAVAEIAGNPCVIHDANHRRIAEGGADGSPVDSILDEQFREHPALSRQIEDRSDKRATIVGPLPAAGVRRRFLIAPIEVRAELWGYLVIEERKGRFGKTQGIIAQRAASLIALELVATLGGTESLAESRNALVGALIREGNDLDELERRAYRFGLDLRHPRLVAVVQSRVRASEPTPGVRQFAGTLGEEISELVTHELGDSVVVIAPCDPKDDDVVSRFKQSVSKAVSATARSDELVLGISSLCVKPDDYTRAYFEATQIVDLLLEHGPQVTPEGVLAVAGEDLGAGRLLLASHNARQLDRFLSDTLGPLFDLEDSRMVALLATIDHYFRACRSTGRVAAELGVHENSVRYRLARVEELTGIDFSSDGDALLALQLALCGLRLRGALHLEKPPFELAA